MNLDVSKVSQSVHLLPVVPPNPLYHENKGMDWDHPKASHFVRLLPMVHPIPLYLIKEGTDWDYPKMLHSSPLYIVHCSPSYPTVSWEERDHPKV